MIRLLSVPAAVLALTACSPADTPATPTEPADAPASVAPAATSASSAPGVEDLTAISCTGPFKVATTEADLRARFGADAVKIETVPGPEGTELTAAVIHGGDPTRRLEAVWADDARTQLSLVRAGPEATAITLPGGVHIGSTLAEVATANGGPFGLWGFDWDYGGNVADWRGGKLTPSVEGCVHGVRFSPGEGATDYAQGDAQFASDDSSVVAAKPVVAEVSIGLATAE